MSPVTVDLVVAATIIATIFGPPGAVLAIWYVLDRRHRRREALDREIAEIEEWLANIRNTT